MAPASFSHSSALPAMNLAISMVCGCLPPDSRATGMPQWSLTLGSTCDARIEQRHLLHRAHYDDGPLVGAADEFLVLLAPARHPGRHLAMNW